MASLPPHHYAAMGLHRRSTEAELKESWRRLSRELHPDRLGGTPEANDAFAVVSQAYAVLSDRKSRAAYDAGLDLASRPCDGCGGEGRVGKQKGFTQKTYTTCEACLGSGRASAMKRRGARRAT